MMVKHSGSRIIVALDYANMDDAMELAGKLSPDQCRMKVGKELFVRSGPAIVSSLQDMGFDVFLDLKFHDIPNTVAAACRAAADLGVWMVNVHASGGQQMMEAARKAIDETGCKTILIAVTVLTSMDKAALASLGLNIEPAEQVQRLVRLSMQSGMDGVVCSAQESRDIRALAGDDFVLVTPGIRPSGSDKGDQSRVMTPAQAIKAGSDYLVIGRPITAAADPLASLAAIQTELSVSC